MRHPSYLPNLLSSLRIALAPAMAGAATANSKAGFTGLLALSLIFDALDGAVARRWKAESDVGRRLDRWGDSLALVLASIGLFLLWPRLVEREWPWAVAALAGYGLIGVQRLVEPPGTASRTRWGWKVLGWVMPLSLLPLIQGWSPWPFRVAAALQAAIGCCRSVGAWTRRTREKPTPAVALATEAKA